MDCRKLSQLDGWEVARLVWMGAEKGGDAPRDAAPTAARPEADPARAAAQAAEGGVARKAGDEAQAAERQDADANLPAQLAAAEQAPSDQEAAPPAPPVAPEAPPPAAQAGASAEIQAPSSEDVARVLKAYKAEQFLAAELDKEGGRQKFYDSITDEKDKAVAKWIVESTPTQEEKDALVKELGDTMPKEDEEVAKMAEAGKLDYRKQKVCRTILQDLRKAAEAQSAIPESVKGLGIVAILEKLFEKLAKLAEKFTAQIDKMFKKEGQEEQAPTFAKSPLGDSKITISRSYEAGKGIDFHAAPGQHLIAIEPGIVTVQNDSITITRDNGTKIVYTHVVAAEGIAGTRVDSGKPIAKSGPQGVVQLKLLDKEEQERDPTVHLQPYIQEGGQPATVAAAPAEAEQAAPAQAPASAAPEAQKAAPPAGTPVAAARQKAQPPAAPPPAEAAPGRAG